MTASFRSGRPPRAEAHEEAVYVQPESAGLGLPVRASSRPGWSKTFAVCDSLSAGKV
jgi:hypothetical protein